MFDSTSVNSLPTLGASLLSIGRQASQIRRHVQLLHWLQGEIQRLLPHDILIAAWGDFSLELVQLDIVSSNPAVRTRHAGQYVVMPLVRKLFDWWYAGGRRPTSIDTSSHNWFEELSSDHEMAAVIRRMRTATVHGIKDERGRHDCLYITLSSQPASSPFVGEMLETLLPYIDTAMRQVPMLSAEEGDADQSRHNPADTQLSGREVEIMDWVRQGKTNYEIAMILNISAFTVKNHMQRILRKLNVTNRAQATSRVEQWQSQRTPGGKDGRTGLLVR